MNFSQQFSKLASGAAIGRLTLALFLVVFVTGATLAQTKAYVTNSGSNTVSVISTATNTVTATVPVGINPQFFAFTKPQPPVDPIAALIDQVEALIAGGTLTQNQGAGLIDKLNQIAAKLGANQTAAVCNQLSAFINQVQALINNGSLSQAQGAIAH